MADDIFVGSVSVGVVPNARNWNNDLRRQLVPASEQIGSEVGESISRNITDSMGKAGDKSAGAFSDTFKKRLKAALDSLPKAELDGDSTAVDRKIQEIRAKLEELSRVDIVNSKKAVAELAVVERELGSIARKADGIDVKFNVDTARAQLALLKRDVDSTSRPGIISRAAGGIGNITPGLVGTGGQGGQAGAAGLAALAPSSALVNPYTIGAALSALPFLAQAAAGAITFGLGGAMAGIGILAASKTKEVQKTFNGLKTQANRDLGEIGQTFAPSVNAILLTTRSVMKTLTPLFMTVLQVIRGPFTDFAQTVLKGFTQPAVKTSIEAVAVAFTKILQAFTPDVPGIFDSFAQAITRMAQAISSNPKAFADFLNFIFQIAIAIIDAIAYLTIFVNYIEAHFLPAVHHFVDFWLQAGHDIEASWNKAWDNVVGRTVRGQQDLQRLISQGLHNIANAFDIARHAVSASWDTLWNNTVGRAIRGQRDLQNLISQGLHNIANLFDNTRHIVASIWDTVWNNTVGRTKRGISDTVNAIVGLKNWVVNFFSNSGSWLYNGGKNIITGLWNGIKATWNDVVGWFKGMPHAILKALGIASPPPWSIDAGKHIMGGILKGVTKGASSVKNFFVGLASDIGGPLKAVWHTLGGVGGAIGSFVSKLIGGGGSGVARWAGIVSQALAMLGLSPSLAPRVLYQMQTESGGNPDAINLTDINAQRGDPSRGLMQTIGSTFAAYHVPGTSNNIYDPLANVAAALNYAMHVYGPDLMRGGMGVGSGHGYALGGPINEPIWGFGRSGQFYTFGERGREWVVPDGGSVMGGDGAQYHAHFDGLTGAAIESHVRTAFQAMSLTQGNLNRQGRRS